MLEESRRRNRTNLVEQVDEWEACKQNKALKRQKENANSMQITWELTTNLLKVSSFQRHVLNLTKVDKSPQMATVGLLLWKTNLIKFDVFRTQLRLRVRPIAMFGHTIRNVSTSMRWCCRSEAHMELCVAYAGRIRVGKCQVAYVHLLLVR
jgi:hypothetical protein